MTLQTIEIEEMVSLERGEIDRRIYGDPAIFELEMERVRPFVAVPLPRITDSRAG